MDGPGARPAAPRKSILWPAFLALCFLLPGGVTFSFALGEASSFASDWVYISAPLLALGGLCVVLVLGRLLGRAGRAIGALLLLGGLGAGWYLLDQAIAVRVDYRERYDALQATEKLCDGTGQPDPRAAAYDPKRPGLHPAVVFTRTEHGSRCPYEDDKLYRRFEPDRHQIDRVELVACVLDKPDTVESCRYTEGAVKERIRVDREIQLLVIRTGERLLKTTLVGEVPRACKDTEEFYGQEAKTGAIHGAPPSAADVVRQLEPFLETR
ncbi:MAG TPA: hypothetical protein PK668_20650 [Myxococcota bacterium]|nr:hypothetical protein [Myxococcota bacterium]HRY96241.1 hypothetical protein [Myxococcota bacterium]